MDMFESKYVLTSGNKMQGWSDYAQFFKRLIQDVSVELEKPIIYIAHTKDQYDEKAMEYKTFVPIKGALANQGIESYFNIVVSTKKKSLEDLQAYSNDLLTISEEEQDLGMKYVFQTRLTKDTLGERIRTPMGMFNKQETFIDNDVETLLGRVKEFYGE